MNSNVNKMIKTLQESINTYDLLKCNFEYSSDNFYYYIYDVNNEFILGLKEDDFIVDGFEIRKMGNLLEVELRDDGCVEINKNNKILDNIQKPNINLKSWFDIFNSLKNLYEIIIVECEEIDPVDSEFIIGKITKINKEYIKFRGFDIYGNWYNEITTIYYDDITSVTFNSRYCNEWKKYLK